MSATPAAQAVVPSAARRVGALLRRAWWIIALAILLTVITVFTRGNPLTSVPGHPENANANGMRAIAQILGQQGVDVRIVGTVADAVALAENAEATVLVTEPGELTDAELASLPADVVIEGSPYLTGILSDKLQISSAGSTTVLTPICDNPDAVVAGSITSSRGSVTAVSPDVEVCFPVDESLAGAYAVWEQDGRTWHYLADMSIFRNELLAQNGNAALGLRVLGANPLLVWLIPTPEGGNFGLERDNSFAPWFEPALLVGAGVVLLLIVAGGGRMGRVVTEPLPVVVRPGETVIGRGTLYRRAGAVAHSAQGLRAGTARRLATATGLPRTAGPEELTEAVSSATGRTVESISSLLYGPPPTRSKQLTQLAEALKALESEVRHS